METMKDNLSSSQPTDQEHAVSTKAAPKVGGNILLYDGVCGLCDKLVQFVLPRDTQGLFQFASLQSKFSEDLLSHYQLNASDLNTFYAIADYGLPSQHIMSKSDAAAFVLSKLGGIWSALSNFKYIPKPLRNWGYDTVAKNRYQIFGKTDVCRMPEAGSADRFIDV
jgi:predicted DCC family thiol-disulfide oxidoreductase YuxK